MNINLKNSVHIFLASKGGVGKTTLCALLAEWLYNQGSAPVVFDADAKNVDACISNYKGLNADRLSELLVKNPDGSERITEAGFERLLESLMEEDGPHVIDTGANTYTQWLSYVSGLDLKTELEDAAKTVFVHTIVAGGEMCEETVRGLEEIAARVPTWKLVVWVNEYKSPARLRSGEHFLESQPYVALYPRFAGVVQMGEVSDVQRNALDALGPLHLLASEVRADGSISSQKRIAFNQWSRQAFRSLDKVFGVAAQAVA